MKRILTIAVILVLVLSLSGCSRGGGAFDFLITWEATEFTDQDVEFLRHLYHIPKKIEATFIKSKEQPCFFDDCNHSETFFYIYADDNFDAVKLYVNNVLLRKCWRECDEDYPNHNYGEFKFDDGIYYTPVIQLDHSESECALVIYKNKRKELYKDPDKYLVYVRTPETVEALSKMKAAGAGNMGRYQSKYGLIID